MKSLSKDWSFSFYSPQLDKNERGVGSIPKELIGVRYIFPSNLPELETRSYDSTGLQQMIHIGGIAGLIISYVDNWGELYLRDCEIEYL